MQFNPSQYKAKRGKSETKKLLDKEWNELNRMGWHLTILSIDNESSTYNGTYPEGVGVARDENNANKKAIEEHIVEISIKK